MRRGGGYITTAGPDGGSLFGVSPSDLASVLTAAALLFAASLLACLPPALRAMRVDPVQGLRTE
jgi:ABC-type lipoprotein release transport system permease subunit